MVLLQHIHKLFHQLIQLIQSTNTDLAHVPNQFIRHHIVPIALPIPFICNIYIYIHYIH